MPMPVDAHELPLTFGPEQVTPWVAWQQLALRHHPAPPPAHWIVSAKTLRRTLTGPQRTQLCAAWGHWVNQAVRQDDGLASTTTWLAWVRQAPGLGPRTVDDMNLWTQALLANLSSNATTAAVRLSVGIIGAWTEQLCQAPVRAIDADGGWPTSHLTWNQRSPKAEWAYQTLALWDHPQTDATVIPGLVGWMRTLDARLEAVYPSIPQPEHPWRSIARQELEWWALEHPDVADLQALAQAWRGPENVLHRPRALRYDPKAPEAKPEWSAEGEILMHRLRLLLPVWVKLPVGAYLEHAQAVLERLAQLQWARQAMPARWPSDDFANEWDRTQSAAVQVLHRHLGARPSAEAAQHGAQWEGALAAMSTRLMLETTFHGLTQTEVTAAETPPPSRRMRL